MAFIRIAFGFTLVLGSLAIYRLHSILRPRKRTKVRPVRDGQTNAAHILIVLGSGGHTAEMLAMLERALNEADDKRRLEWRDYAHRTWVVGSGDAISAQRAKDFEEMASQLADERENGEAHRHGSSVIVTVPRARRIHQSVYTAPFSSLRCMIACCAVLLHHANKERGFPDLILCNGPATATVMIITSILLRFFNIGQCQTNSKMHTIYVESWARVKKLSLSGRLLLALVDRFLVQWPQLEQKTSGKAEYLGVLV